MDTFSSFLPDVSLDRDADPFRAERKIGRSVIAMAAADAISAAGTRDIHASVRDEARAFLRGGEMLAFWCEVAGLPIALVQRVARQRWPVSSDRVAA